MEDRYLIFSSLQADKIKTLVKAAGIEVEAIWSSLFAKALEGETQSVGWRGSITSHTRAHTHTCTHTRAHTHTQGRMLGL